MHKPQVFAVIRSVTNADRDGFRCVEMKADVTENYITETLTAVAPVEYLTGHYEDNRGVLSLLGRQVLLRIVEPQPEVSYDRVCVRKQSAQLYFVGRRTGNVLADNPVWLSDWTIEVDDRTPKPQEYIGGAHAPCIAPTPDNNAFLRNVMIASRQLGKSEIVRKRIEELRAQGHTVYAIPRATMNTAEPFEFKPAGAQPWSDKHMRTFQSGINNDAQAAINAAENGIKRLETLLSDQCHRTAQAQGNAERNNEALKNVTIRAEAQVESLRGEVEKLRQSNSDKRKRIKELQETLDKSGQVATLEGNTDAANVQANYANLVFRIAEALGHSGVVTNDSLVAAVASVKHGYTAEVKNRDHWHAEAMALVRQRDAARVEAEKNANTANSLNAQNRNKQDRINTLEAELRDLRTEIKRAQTASVASVLTPEVMELVKDGERVRKAHKHFGLKQEHTERWRREIDGVNY